MIGAPASPYLFGWQQYDNMVVIICGGDFRGRDVWRGDILSGYLRHSELEIFSGDDILVSSKVATFWGATFDLAPFCCGDTSGGNILRWRHSEVATFWGGDIWGGDIWNLLGPPSSPFLATFENVATQIQMSPNVVIFWKSSRPSPPCTPKREMSGDICFEWSPGHVENGGDIWRHFKNTGGVEARLQTKCLSTFISMTRTPLFLNIRQ